MMNRPNLMNNVTPTTLNQWRLQVLERDTYICQRCGMKNKQKLRAHHIRDTKLYPHLKYYVPNEITYCTRCHRLQPIQHNLFMFKNDNWLIPKRVNQLEPPVIANDIIESPAAINYFLTLLASL